MSIIIAKDMVDLLRHSAANIQPNELCIAWHRKLGKAGWGDKKSCEDNMRNWRKAKRQNKLYINPKESREVKINGEPWHILIVQEGTPENTRQIGFDPLGFGMDDVQILVDGMIYFFRNKANRDMVANYVMK
jgi:hypothetical protein